MDTQLALIQQGSSPPSFEADQGSWPQPDDSDAEFLPVDTLATMYRDYLQTKMLEIEEQKTGRHYYHGAHYTADELRILKARGQQPITYNRMARKINQIVGLVQRVRQDPKAYPKTPNGETGAEIANMTIRYTLDSGGDDADWTTLETDCILQGAIDGIGGVEMRLVEGDKGDPDIELHQVYGDEYFYDPVSNKANFRDARYDGIAKWIDADEAGDLFPEKVDLINGLVENGSDLTTYADREFKWVLTRQRRVRLVEIWYKFKGKVCWAFFVGRTLLEQGTSPFYDSKGRQMSRFIMFSAAVDHDGDRYGFPRNLKGPQDEINARRSKGLFISNSRRIIAEKGAVNNVEVARREWARADGWVEVNPGKEIKPDDTKSDLAAQMSWLEEAKNEIENFAMVDASSMKERVGQNMSGKAINLLQAPGLAEISPFVKAVRGWKLRVYRAIWCAQHRLWTQERWIRVTGADDQQKQRFLQVNGMELDQWGRPQLVNFLGSIDVDIKIDEGPDEVTLAMDIWDIIKQDQNFPPQAKIEVMPIPQSKKQALLKALEPKPTDPVEQATKQKIIEGMDAENEKTRAQVIGERTKAVANIALAAANATKAMMSGQAVYAEGEAFGPISPQAAPGSRPVAPQGPGPSSPLAPAAPGGPPPASGAAPPPANGGPPDPAAALAALQRFRQPGPQQLPLPGIG